MSARHRADGEGRFLFSATAWLGDPQGLKRVRQVGTQASIMSRGVGPAAA